MSCVQFLFYYVCRWIGRIEKQWKFNQKALFPTFVCVWADKWDQIENAVARICYYNLLRKQLEKGEDGRCLLQCTSFLLDLRPSLLAKANQSIIRNLGWPGIWSISTGCEVIDWLIDQLNCWTRRQSSNWDLKLEQGTVEQCVGHSIMMPKHYLEGYDLTLSDS